MTTVASQKVHPPTGWMHWGGAVVLLGALVALAFAVAEVRATGRLASAPLLVLVPLNGLIVYRLGASLSKDLGRLFAFFPPGEMDPQTRVNWLLGHPLLMLCGVGFATFLGVGVWQVDPWQDEADRHALRLWLSAFLFCNNLIIGAVLCAIMRFWHVLLRVLDHIDFHILNLSSPVLNALLKVNSRLVMGTAVVCSLAVCSIPLSSYTMNPITQLFSGFALAVVVATYAVPILPLSNVLSARKVEAMHRLERLIEAHVRLRSGQAPREGMPASADDLPPLKDLLEARDIVAQVRTLPPGGQFSVSAAAIVAFLSFLPTLIDYAISKLP